MEIYDSYFYNITGWSGSALYVDGVRNITIDNTIFDYNRVPTTSELPVYYSSVTNEIDND